MCVDCLINQAIYVSYIKQSKERPGSIVTETLKNGILIPVVTLKELHFYASSKYISFIKFNFTHQKLRACENLPYFRK